jgi:transposase
MDRPRRYHLFSVSYLEQGARAMTTAAMNVSTLGIDLGKNVFHVIGMNARGTIVLRERLSRAKLPKRLANTASCLIGMEACAGAHHVGRQLAGLGHDVRLIPAAYVKPFLKGHKNDYRDAEAIAEAVQRPTMRFVPLKSSDQLDLQALHRVRSRLVGQRTAVINQIRGFLVERGITVRQGPAGLRRALPSILAQPLQSLSALLLHLIEDLIDDWRRLDARIQEITNQIENIAKLDENCRRLMGTPGVGPVIASAMVAAIGHGSAFRKGRDFAAWLGLVPKQISTGNRTVLGGISRRGNRYLRTLLIQGARSLLFRPDSWGKYGLARWLTSAAQRLHKNVLAVALANKLARITWAVLHRGSPYEPGFTAQAA